MHQLLSSLASIVPATALAFALAVPATALAADQNGPNGAAHKVEINSPSADTYLQYHGRLIVRSGKAKAEYRWGGTSCGSRVLSDQLIDLLVQATRDNDSVNVVPRYQDGQAGAKCLVGFAIVNKR